MNLRSLSDLDHLQTASSALGKVIENEYGQSMRQFGEILLVSCYELGHQPLGLALPMGFLERAGFLPAAIDLSVEKLGHDKVKRACLIAISVPMHTALRIAIEAVTQIRKISPDVHIVFFGLYASLNSEMLLKHVADSVIGGECESQLLALAKSLEAGIEQPLTGVSTREHISPPLLEHLPFPTPSRKGLPPLTQYAHLIKDGQKQEVGYVEASRGCRHHCRHCPIPSVYEGRFFLMPQELVLDDIKTLIEMGASHITFGDPDFLNGPVHSLRVARSLHKMFPDVTFDFTAKVEHLIKYQTYLPELASLGCIFIISAVESFSEVILSHLAKNHTRSDAIKVFHLTNKMGIALRPTFVPFTPWTTLEDILDLFETIEKEGMMDYIDPVQYTIRLLIPPGSLLLSELSLRPYLGPLNENEILFPWHNPQTALDKLQKLFSQEVEKTSCLDENPETIFYQLKEYTLSILEKRAPVVIKERPRKNPLRPPRMTEPWFCCAEPTNTQMASLKKNSSDTLESVGEIES